MSQSPALIAQHSEELGQLLRTISVDAKSAEASSSDNNISLMGFYQRTLIREHLGQHMLLHPAEPLPEIWSYIALSAATALKGQDNWLARQYAELGYAHPLGVEADKPALRQIILETLPASLINAEGKAITDMLYDPLDKLRASGVFRRDPALALIYNDAFDVNPPQELKDLMGLKALLVLGMDSTAPEARAIREQLNRLFKTASPSDAYFVASVSRIILDQDISALRPLPDRMTRTWVTKSLTSNWNKLCKAAPAEARKHYSYREKDWGLKKPAAG